MDFFTESVDAALWTSRTYDDPSYDDDASAAAESRSPITVESHERRASPCHLIVSVGAAADATLGALAPTDTTMPLATLSGAGVPERTLHLCTHGPLQGCAWLSATGLLDDRAASWAYSVLGAVGGAPVVVATSAPRACVRGGREAGVRALATKDVTVIGVTPLSEPDFVAGAAAAVVAEAEWRDMQAVCLVGVTERANFDVDEVGALADAVCKAVTALGGNASVGDEVRNRVKEVSKKSAIAAHDSIYL